MEIGNTLKVTEREQWRAWLVANHAREPEIWLVYPNKASGKPRLPYNDAVDEALCFGWIDSIVKSLDAEHAAQRFTPRRPESRLSELNKVRVRRLAAAGRMTPAGLAAAGDVLDEPFVIPDDILAALQADAETWRNFQAFPESYRRIRVGWIDMSRRRADVFRQRLDYLLRMTKQNKRLAWCSRRVSVLFLPGAGGRGESGVQSPGVSRTRSSRCSSTGPASAPRRATRPSGRSPTSRLPSSRRRPAPSTSLPSRWAASSR